MWFGTDHLSTKWNLNILWAMPLNLPILLFLLKKETPKFVLGFVKFYRILLITLLIGWCLNPQTYHAATLPLILIAILFTSIFLPVPTKEDFNKRTLLEIHRLILKSIDNENAGRYRTVPVRISGSRHEPPQPYLLDKMMEDYFIHYEHQKKRLHPVLLAAEMHERLVSIHPFIDGNGRTSRLVMNFILLKHGYTVTSLKGDLNSRMAYYKALEEVQVNNDATVFYDLIIQEVIGSLNAHLKMV